MHVHIHTDLLLAATALAAAVLVASAMLVAQEDELLASDSSGTVPVAVSQADGGVELEVQDEQRVDAKEHCCDDQKRWPAQHWSFVLGLMRSHFWSQN